MTKTQGIIAGALLTFVLGTAEADPGNTTAPGEPDTVVLVNGIARISINRYGGAIASFSLNEQGLNPFTWKSRK